MQSRLRTAGSWARIIGVSYQTVEYRERVHKEFPRPAATTMGGESLYSEDQIRAYLEDYPIRSYRRAKAAPGSLIKHRDQIKERREV